MVLTKTTQTKETHMKSIIGCSEEEQKAIEQWKEPDWGTFLGEEEEDMVEIALRSGALVRARKIKGVQDLLRLVLAYAVGNWSLRMVAIWGTLRGIAYISDVGLLYRFRRCQGLLGRMMVRVLQRRNAYLQQTKGVRVRLIDATVITQPGSSGTDWRTHTVFDLENMCLSGLVVTDAHGGEKLTRFPAQKGEIWIGDRAYGLASNLARLLKELISFVVRIGWNRIKLQTMEDTRLDLIAWLKSVKTTCERTVHLPCPQGTFPLRLIASPLPADQAQKAREKIVRQAKKKGKVTQPHSYLAAGYVILLTNLPSDFWPTERVLWLYRLRWQIELQFKRLKGLLTLDHLPAQDPCLVQTFLFAKLLAALLLDQCVLRTTQLQPHWFASLQRPVSLWRLHALLWLGIRDLILGSFSLSLILQSLPLLQRYLCDAPRRRIQKLAWARSILSRLQAVPC
jgi:IS4 transposase